MEKYDHKSIEEKWHAKWEEESLYRTGEDRSKKKYYVLDMFPYPSGTGLHIGHVKGYSATDILARMKRMQGYNVLHPMGWDAFGLPAENYALKNKTHPKIQTEKNVAYFKQQLKGLGFSYDWEREINTTDPEYYKWTQWAFIKMWEKGLAYESFEPIIWCPKCQTGLAMEDLEDGKCERCESEVERKPMRQWVIKITDYADRLLNDIDKLAGWEDSIKEMQRNWIGRSEGAEINFKVLSLCKGELEAVVSGESKGPHPASPCKGEEIKVFTTRPDTLFGCTYVVLAPEHPAIGNWQSAIGNWPEVEEYIKKTKAKSDLERTDLNKDKSGVKLEGVMAVNPANGQEVPVFIADYVLANYGTGAVMAVPAHDQRDFEFARKYDLPIKTVVTFCHSERPEGERNPSQSKQGEQFFSEKEIKCSQDRDRSFAIAQDDKKGAVQDDKAMENAFCDEGININSEFLNGLPTVEAKKKMIAWLEENNCGQKKVNYKLNDWVFSRQRYWGEPIPFVHCDKCGTVPVDIEDLPVRLPEVEHYEPTGTGESPLANISEWVNTTCPKCGGAAKRETNTMPQWAGSSWYYLRYMDPRNDEALVDMAKEKYWSPVDFYVGGAEHATRHLIYARFWHKFLLDIGVVNYEEPFTRLQHVGLVLGSDGKKISKRLNNGADPLAVAAEFGADALRIYEMFMGPFGQSCAWDNNGPAGVNRFLNRIWALSGNPFGESSKNISSLLHKTIKKVSEDIPEFKYNTCVSAMMILLNAIEGEKGVSKDDFAKFIQILSPFAPHLAEEVWEKLGNRESVFKSAWPEYDEELIKDETINLVVQVNGKLRATIQVAADISEDDAKKAAFDNADVKKWVDGKETVKIVFVPGKLLNIVVK